MISRKNFASLSLMAVLFLLPQQSLAASEAAAHGVIAHATFVHGDVSLEREGHEPVSIALGDALYEGDTLRTDQGEYVELEFIDNTHIELTGMNGSLTLNEYVFDPENPADNKAHYSVLKGSFKYISGLLSHHDAEKSNITIDLDFGSIGIRGTTVYRAMSDGECWIFLEDGLIDVSNDGGSVSLQPGDGTRIHDLAVAPVDAAPWGQKRIDWIKGEMTKP